MPDHASNPPPISRACALGLFAIGALMVVCLWLMGRVAWCQAGDWVPWSWDVWSEHNSQHLVDAYSLSHLEHGLGLFLILRLIPSKWLTLDRIYIIIALVEASWEVAENTPLMINRYREATISLDYFGDSIANSVSDYLMCLVGVAFARRVPWQLTLLIIGVFEMVSVVWIRDSLMLNIVMLIYPIEAIKQWQAQGQPTVSLSDWFAWLRLTSGRG